jgi:hypothetical protein
MMNSQAETSADPPYSSLASGIAHGPYRAAPSGIVDLYMTRHQSRPDFEPTVSDEQKRADIESEWQYDQHSAAVMEALEAGRITHVHAYYMLEKVLRPWFIGRRLSNE